MGKVESAVLWAVGIALDDTHGYDQERRQGPDYDCSSLIINAYEQAGVPVKEHGAGYTGNMYAAFLKAGFRDVTASVNLHSGEGLVRGDVCLAPGKHVVMCVGAGQVVHASLNELGKTTGGRTGDQTGREICVRSYYNRPWTYVLRYPEGDAPAASGNAARRLLRKGSRGEDVAELQRALSAHGHALAADGVFGPLTDAAVRAFQASASLKVDGAVGPLTRRALGMT